MNKLLDDENKEDKTFWNQEALKEEENDENYEEGEVVDVFDGDFDDDNADKEDTNISWKAIAKEEDEKEGSFKSWKGSLG
ncbi:SWR1 complex subunit 2-like isoform X3 [Camellia sinensis]|uniref:SWR1 complex subunit 2-like isoform X3 n=1 Tax=Camellia sinensis TaxID=4442 RepID=UPI00103594F5|nr:SWR1 complex subunit 2-like isoform X3 [Camellia sinensis]